MQVYLEQMKTVTSTNASALKTGNSVSEHIFSMFYDLSVKVAIWLLCLFYIKFVQYPTYSICDPLSQTQVVNLEQLNVRLLVSLYEAFGVKKTNPHLKIINPKYFSKFKHMVTIDW